MLENAAEVAEALENIEHTLEEADIADLPTWMIIAALRACRDWVEKQMD